MDLLAFFRREAAETYLHGTRHTLEPGQILEGGSVRSNQGNGAPGQHVYFTRLHDVAREFAEAGYGPDHDLNAQPRVYHVEPLDDVEPDPDEDPETHSFRSRRVRVVKQAAAPPGPHPNPEGGHHWYHGTPLATFDDGDEERHDTPPSTPDRYESEYFQNGEHHWNTDLGSHWTSLPETARYFANGMSHSRSVGDGRIATASLHMANPKHYKSEFDMSGEAIHWAKNAGFRHLPDDEDAHHTFVAGGRFGPKGHVDLSEGAMDHWGKETPAGHGHSEQVDYSSHPYAGHGNNDIRKSISAIDREDDDVTGDELKTIHGGGRLDAYLAGHPLRSEITTGFKKHLMDQGHDGVTYGNQYEEPIGHACAIPFHDDHINLHKWEPVKHFDKKNYERPEEEVAGQQALVQPTWNPGTGPGWETHDGKTAAKETASVDELKSMLGTDAWHRAMTLGEATGESMHVPTPSHDMPERRGYKPGDDLDGIDKGPYVGWVKTEHLLKHREYDRRGKDANPDSPATIAHIRSTMREHGMTDPVILSHDPHSDRAMLVEGNHRLQSAVEEGWPAVPVHVVRAYRREAEDMPRTHYLGSHKVQPDEHGYTPGTLHPRDALPDHYLHDGKGKTAAIWHEPRPEYQAPPEDVSDDERLAHGDQQRSIRDNWTHETRKALSRGDLSPQQAVDNGYHNQGHDSGNGRHGTAESLAWKPLPSDLYHVTTDLKGSLTHGLKSRRELNQDYGKGLGGGEDDTISFTTDKHLAHSILDSMHEFHDVVNGRKTPAHMWDEAQQGTGAARPFHKELKRYSGAVDGKRDHHFDAMMTGKKIEFGMATQEEMDAKHGKGVATPHPSSKPISLGGGGTHLLWQREATPDEKIHDAVDFYKRFSRTREAAGGRPDPVFWSTDTKGFAKMDPSNFGIVHAKPKPGAHGYPVSGMSEWRSCDGKAVDLTHHSKTASANPLDGYDVHHFFEERAGGWGHHTLHVEHDDDHVGHITWTTSETGKRPPTIEGVWVRDDHQRRGIATELLRRAREITPGIQHSDVLSPEGEAWSQKVGRWLPHDRIFGPGHGGLDPRLFDAKKKMRPEVASVILGDLDGYWGKDYPDWREWTRVYLAGSEASEWYGNNDFDTLIGIEHKRLRKAHPEFAAMLDEDIDNYLTAGLKEHLNDEDWKAPWDGQIWHRTYYVNPNSWDIRAIKPYAAYDITRGRWIVEPMHPASDWGPEKLPSSYWDEAEAIVRQVHAIEAMPEPMRTGRAAALFDYLHHDRRRAFGPHGTGVYDPGNATWKYLDLHPDQPLGILIDLKRRYENQIAQEATA